MINFLKSQKVIIGLVAILFTFHFLSKDITNPYERPIAGDAQAYYAYLPAIFIYQDLDYEFVEEAAAPHYPPGHLKDFVVDVDGQKVNKTFPGVTVLYAPFFFAGHLSAKILGKSADGYATIYQLWFDIGIWVYFFFGLVFMRKVLENLKFSSKTALFTTFLVALATNVFFYTVYDQSVTHVHNFFMINGLILCLLNFKDDQKSKWLIIAFGLLMLIGITRPTNILVVGLIVFFFPSIDFFKSVFSRIFSKEIWKFALIGLPIIALPFLLWKAQTGNWVVYSYGEEGFDFAHPHFFEFIFSYTKGWMTYTPFVIPVLIFGLIILFKNNKKRFVIALVFYLLSIYIFSSWWCWYYGAGMSQRVMIDHYILLAFLLASIIKHIELKPTLKKAGLVIAGILVLFNIAQAYQINNGIIQFGSATQEQYWDNFLVLENRARVYPKDHWDKIEDLILTQNPPIKGENYEYYSRYDWITVVSAENTYSAVACDYFRNESISKQSKLILSFEVEAKSMIENCRAVLTLQSKADHTQEQSFPIFFKEFTNQDEWTEMEFLIEPNGEFTDTIQLFFWNGDTQEKASFRNVSIHHFKTDQYM
jgi:hypothetical protein